jgi:uncharacterized protein (TIGR03435 family)
MKNLALALLLSVPAAAAPKAPDFRIAQVLNAPAGKISGLTDLKGKVVFIEFWATWCGPCVAGIPRTNRLIDALKGQPVVFLAVTDEPADMIRTFLKTHEMKAWVGIDQAQSSLKAFKVFGRPDGYLIGKDGTLLDRVHPDALKEKEVREALAGRLRPRPVQWGDDSEAKAPAKAGHTFFELRISSAQGQPGMTMGPDGLEGQSLPFAFMISWIWDVQPDQVLVDTAPVSAFNFLLKTPPDGFEQGREVLKGAVQSTFDVGVTPVRRETDVYLLTLSTGSGAPRPTPAAPEEKSGLMGEGGGRLLGKSSMARAARGLWMSLEKPVVDETGLPGEFHFDLEWEYRDQAALDRALASCGLRLLPGRREVDFLRVTPNTR